MRIKIFAELVTHGGRLALPFIAVLAVSSTLAYALDDALVAGPPAMGKSMPACGDGLMYVGLNSWIPSGPATHCAFREP
jgi:hypothetical protein